MKIRNFKIILIAPFLLLTPMMCMHLGDGHYGSNHHSLQYRPPSFHISLSEGVAEQGFFQVETTDSGER